MKVRFYNFSKRKNSTKQPSGTYTEKECKLKDDTSMHDPTVQIAADPTPGYTYAYIPDWDKYYYVQDQVSIAKGITDIVMTEDPMASNKTAIGNCSTRVAFCTNPYYSTKTDPRLSVHTTKTIKFSSGSSFLDMGGCYVLSVMSKTGGAGGVCAIYLMDTAAMSAFCDWINDTSVAAAISSFFNGDLLSGILSCIWVPFPTSAIDVAGTHPSMPQGTLVSTVIVGERSSLADDGKTISCIRLDSYAQARGGDLLSIHLTYPKTDFRAVEPYTSGSLFLPGVGVVDVSMSDLVGGDTISVGHILEFPTGNVTYTISNSNGDLIQTASCCLASPCPLGQVQTNFGGAASSIKTAVAGVAGVAATALTGGLTGAVAAASSAAVLAGGAGAVLALNQRSASISGSNGSRVIQTENVIYYEFAVDTEDPEDSSGYIAIKGRPLGEVVTISSCSGYIECDGASVDLAGSERERDEINAMLNTGFYYE